MISLETFRNSEILFRAFFAPAFLSGAQCVRECLWDCNTSVHFSPFALHLCTWLRVTVRERMTSHEAPLNLRCGVNAIYALWYSV